MLYVACGSIRLSLYCLLLLPISVVPILGEGSFPFKLQRYIEVGFKDAAWQRLAYHKCDSKARVEISLEGYLFEGGEAVVRLVRVLGSLKHSSRCNVCCGAC